jgi:hypothetical protein
MENPMIYSAIVDAMGQINAIAKGRSNSMQNFKYRGIDDVMNELHPILAKCGIFIVPTVLEEQRAEGKTSKGGVIYFTRLKIKFTFYAKDGSFFESVVIGEAMDSGDKASNKALYIGLKYALLQVFCIPTEDDKDPDSVSYDFIENNKGAEKAFDIVPQKQTSEARVELNKLLTKYEKQLDGNTKSGNPYKMGCEAMAGDDEAKVEEILGRVKAFLKAQGIAV